MSELHVTQIAGFLEANFYKFVDLSDCSNHKDNSIIDKIKKTRSLAAFSLVNTCKIDPDTACRYVVDGANDNGMDAIYYDEIKKTLFIIQSKWQDDGNGSISTGDLLKFIEGTKKILARQFDQMNARIKALRHDIEKALMDANAKFHLLITYTGSNDLSKEAKEIIDNYMELQNDTSEILSYSVYSQSKTHKAIADGVAGIYVNVELQLLGWGQVADPKTSFYGQVCAVDVAQWYREHGDKLFSKNIRQVMVKTSVNDDMKSTLLEEPELFWFYNNGITAIAQKIRKKPLGGNAKDYGIFECESFSVVNGAQTVGAIYAAFQENSEKIQSAKVSIRIIEAEDLNDSFANHITRNTNTQNAIERRDFVALDQEQERIRRELKVAGIEYSYKTGGQATDPSSSCDITDATIALACSHHDVDLSVQAKRELGKLWEDITTAPYKKLFNGSVSGPYIWEKVVINRIIESELLQIRNGDFEGRVWLICVHGNRFIQWLSNRRLKDKIIDGKVDEDTIKSIVRDAASETCKKVAELFPDSYPAALFKNLTKCRELAATLG